MTPLRSAQFHRPNPTTVAFAAGRLPRASDQLVLDAAQSPIATDKVDVSQVVVLNEDVQKLTQQPTALVNQAAEALRPGGTLMLTTGRSAMFQGNALESQLKEAGFKNFGLVVEERAYLTAEKATAKGVDDLTPQQSHLLLARTQFAGKPQAHGEIQGADLAPRYSTEVRGRRIHLSKPFESRGYNAYIGYVEADDGALHARTFYQSKSQGIWRSASGLLGSTFGKGPEGRFESSTNLPSEMQQRLSELSRNSEKAVGQPERLESALHAPLAKLSVSQPSRFDQSLQVQPFGKFERQVAINDYNSVGDPSSFRFDHPGQQPDFDSRAHGFEMEHPTRGNLKATAVSSKDGESQYIFLQDKEQRTWLGMVESKGELNDYGVPRKALDEGALTHPAIEYVQQAAPQFRGEVVTWDTVYNNLTKTEETLPGYVDTTAYTKQLPPVRDFLASRELL